MSSRLVAPMAVRSLATAKQPHCAGNRTVAESDPEVAKLIEREKIRQVSDFM